ncbi:MAG: leucine-rich repeat protein [Clostridia bacterium]|nr:leucine-rich repeat protein [Clostridia bacterium]
MEISLNCPRCGEEVVVDLEKAHKIKKCPHCGQPWRGSRAADGGISASGGEKPSGTGKVSKAIKTIKTKNVLTAIVVSALVLLLGALVLFNLPWQIGWIFLFGYGVLFLAAEIVYWAIFGKKNVYKRFFIEENDAGDGIRIAGYIGLFTATVPQTIGGCVVNEIGANAFWKHKALRRITLPDSVNTIGYGAFFHCVNLKSIRIPASVTKIGDAAFVSCNKLTEAALPEGLTVIEQRTFLYCRKLKSVTIPDSVTKIGDYAFEGCDQLEFNKIYGSSLKYLGNENNPYMVCMGASYSGINSCRIHERSKIIYSEAFANQDKLQSVTIPKSIIFIGSWAFYKCSRLTGVEIPDSVTAIGKEAFYRCASLKKIVIPRSVVSMESRVFFECGSRFNKLMIYCEAENQPSGWHKYWTEAESSLSSCSVVWGYKGEES